MGLGFLDRSRTIASPGGDGKNKRGSAAVDAFTTAGHCAPRTARASAQADSEIPNSSDARRADSSLRMYQARVASAAR